MSTILVIEDDDAERGMVQEFLHTAGYRVMAAADGRTGLAMFHQHPADLVVTDIFMPVMDGLEVIHAIRKASPQARIIALRHGQETMETQLLLKILSKYGIEGTVVKPIKRGDLLGCIARALHQDWIPPTTILPNAPQS